MEFKETLEEVAEKNWDKINYQFKGGLNPYAHRIGFIEGAKWQAERMYNGKATEMLEMLEELINLHELGHEIGQYDKARELIKEATEI